MEMWEKRTVLMPSTPLDLCEDKMADAMATALAAIEQRDGERRGCGKPAHLFTVHLMDLDTRSIELRLVPARTWGALVHNPADALANVALQLPAAPPTVERRAYADAPVARVAMMFEGWGRPADREPTEYEFIPRLVQQHSFDVHGTSRQDQDRDVRVDWDCLRGGERGHREITPCGREVLSRIEVPKPMIV